MSGKRSRNKGANAERKIVNIFKEAGYEAFRTAPLQSGYTHENYPDVIVRWNGEDILRIEVKVRKSLPDYIVQYPNADDRTILVMKEDRGQWLAVMPIEMLIELLDAYHKG